MVKKKAGYLGSDDLQTIDYNNDTPIDDLETVDFNNDTEMSDLIDLKETSGTKEVEFMKQVHLHPRERLKRKRKSELNNYSELSKKSKNDITFIRQVHLHPRERLKRKRKAELNNYSELSKKSKNDISFIRQVPKHPRDRLKILAAINEKKLNLLNKHLLILETG